MLLIQFSCPLAAFHSLHLFFFLSGIVCLMPPPMRWTFLTPGNALFFFWLFCLLFESGVVLSGLRGTQDPSFDSCRWRLFSFPPLCSASFPSFFSGAAVGERLFPFFFFSCPFAEALQAWALSFCFSYTPYLFSRSDGHDLGNSQMIAAPFWPFVGIQFLLFPSLR